MSTDINHVSVNALDLQQSVEFYVDLLGAALLPRRTSAFPFSGSASGALTGPSATDRLPADRRARLEHLWDFDPRSEENMRGRRFVP